MVKARVDRPAIMHLTVHRALSMFSRYTHLEMEQSELTIEKLGELISQKSKMLMVNFLENTGVSEKSIPYLLPPRKRS